VPAAVVNTFALCANKQLEYTGGVRQPSPSSDVNDVRPAVIVLAMVPSESWTKREDIRLVTATTSSDLIASLRNEENAIILFGADLLPEDTHRLLVACDAVYPAMRLLVVICRVGDPQVFQNFVDAGQIFYMTRAPVPDLELDAILTAAVSETRYRQSTSRPLSELVAELDPVVEFCYQIALQDDLAIAAKLTSETLRNLIQADNSQFFFYEQQSDVLTVNPPSSDESSDAVTCGLVGYIARTGLTVCVQHARTDPRYDADLDNRGADSDPHFTGAAIFAPDGQTIAVLSAVRSGARLPFSPEDTEKLKVLAVCAGPEIAILLFRSRLRAAVLRRIHDATESGAFRDQAVEHHSRAVVPGRVSLRVAPRWLTSWLTMLMMTITLFVLAFASADETLVCPATIRAKIRTRLVVPMPAVIRHVNVTEGSRVVIGQVLVQFQRQNIPPPATNLTEDVEDLLAPVNGIVTNVRARPGLQIGPEDTVASILDDKQGFELIYVLPAQYVPQIRMGMMIRFHGEGLPGSRYEVQVPQMGVEILRPPQTTGYVGPYSDETTTIYGPVVIVRSALLPEHAPDRKQYSDNIEGLSGTAEIALRHERMMLKLLPGLQRR
jgi:hypothetical protein